MIIENGTNSWIDLRMMSFMTKRIQFSYNHCRTVLKQAGAKQASPEAVEELRQAIESMAFEISKRAALFADDEARFRVTVKDVRSAVREFLHSVSMK